ncbi:PAS-domain containing protein [Jannaschia sp. S6380]|uniref:PAS-domain containing protein n=1 Tax=Jannaschia sp. S6380 TaxID=2926408 RepID=UPI001FF433DA|nr:PAS-domain containing protein [Jannaschia sp. S6380]MCK0168841.1 PAS-domain containing protein [Jannaschia sp. S6380]
MSAILPVIFPLVGGLAVGLGALLAVLWLAPRERQAPPVCDLDILSEPRVFRFRNGYLTDHSENVSFLLPSPIDHLKAWDDLIEALADVNADIGPAFAVLRDAGRPFKLAGQFGRDRILVLGLRDGDDVRITVTTAEDSQSSVRIDLHSLRTMEDELAMLTRAGDTSPALSWATDGEGRVIWANAAYIDLVSRCAGPDAARGWPLHALFPDGEGTPIGKARRKVRDRDGAEHWFEVTTAAPGRDGLRQTHALSLDAVIKAEESLRTFIQTLTKSFAFLPTGLAIFDRDGHLTLFNPGLMDMTGLDGAWLSRRPRLTDFFDALRNRQKLPEPRDYKTWRDGLADRRRDGQAGIYVETWTLPEGATYRVTGRPQDDGAITLMFEDVSAEIVASRNQRDIREMMRDVIDRSEDAIVVFGADGTRMLSNGRARRMWLPDGDEDTDLPATLEGCIAFWKTLAGPSPAWGELRDFVRNPGPDRAEWIEVLNGAALAGTEMRIDPLPGGRVAVAFRGPGADRMPMPQDDRRTGQMLPA